MDKVATEGETGPSGRAILLVTRCEVKKLLLQTTIPYTKDDWSIERFSMLARYLSELTDANGNHLYAVSARNRENTANGDDKILAALDRSDLDQLWLFGVDIGGGLSGNDCAAIERFLQRGGGLLTSRVHQDLGISFCTIGGIGEAHHFHTKNQELDAARRTVDDTETPSLSWPNYHSGNNGDYLRIRVTEPVHVVMLSQKSSSGMIEFLPAHPHEGAVSVPYGANARVIAKGRSTVTGREFNLAVAFESDGSRGRAVADSSFHHFLDYNFDPSSGCPSYVTEPTGRGMQDNPEAMEDTKTYIRNLADWLT